jgi:hypothetical protein
MKTRVRLFPGPMTIMRSIKIEHNIEKYRALTKKEFYISINNDEIYVDFLTKGILRNRRLQVLKLLK